MFNIQANITRGIVAAVVMAAIFVAVAIFQRCVQSFWASGKAQNCWPNRSCSLYVPTRQNCAAFFAFLKPPKNQRSAELISTRISVTKLYNFSMYYIYIYINSSIVESPKALFERAFSPGSVCHKLFCDPRSMVPLHKCSDWLPFHLKSLILYTTVKRNLSGKKISAQAFLSVLMGKKEKMRRAPKLSS